MLKGIPPILTPDLIRILDEMGHGDELVLADRNFPAASVAAETVTGELIQLKGVDDTEAAEAIFALMPIDSYVDEPIRRMEMDGEPDTILEAHAGDIAEIIGPGAALIELGSGSSITRRPVKSGLAARKVAAKATAS